MFRNETDDSALEGSTLPMKRVLRITLAALALTSAFVGQNSNRAVARSAISIQSISFAVRYGNEDQGEETPSRILHHMKLLLKSSAETQSALSTLLKEQSDPTSPMFHNWLTPDEFAKRFGASPVAITKATSWLQANGMSEIQLSHSGRFLTFSGPVSQVSTGFRTAIHRYDVNGIRHFANTVQPTLPAPLADSVSGVLGLNDFTPAPKLRAVDPNYTTASQGNILGPDDLATIYNMKPLYGQNIDGTGITIAVPGMAAINIDDYRAFRTQFGLTPNDYLTVSVPDNPSTLGPGIYALEATLDLAIVAAVARNSKVLYVPSGNVLASVQYVIENNLAQIITYSYAECEQDGDGSLAPYYQELAQQANAQGITWLAASGDSGAAGCDTNTNVATSGLAVTLPASVPEVTGVGGTTFNDFPGQYWASSNNAELGNALSYIPETAWSSAENTGIGVNGGGGGISSYFDRPSFQSGLGNVIPKRRMVPDVAMVAAVGYMIVYGGANQIVAGTSAATPLFAGILALTEDYLLSRGSISKLGLGNINPNLYLLNATVPTAFHDVIIGSNNVACKIGTQDCTTGIMGWSAAPGYDMATGLGSVDAYALASNWVSEAPVQQTSVSTITQVSALSNPVTLGGITASTASIISTLPGTISGTVSFKVGSTILGSAPVTGGKATLSNIAVNAANGFRVGFDAITATYSGDTNFASSIGTTTLTVSPPTYSLSANQISIAENSTITLQLASTHYAGTVSFATSITASSGAVANISASAPPVILSNGGNGTSLLTITSTTANAGSRHPCFPWQSCGAFSLATLLLGTPFTVRRKRLFAVLLSAVAISFSAFLIACGDGSSGASTKSNSMKSARIYTVTVTPMGSGVVLNPAPLTITVTVQ